MFAEEIMKLPSDQYQMQSSQLILMALGIKPRVTLMHGKCNAGELHARRHMKS